MLVDHPRRASRDPLKGATPAARQSRFRGISGAFLASLIICSGSVWAQTKPWHDLGRDATKAEVKAWDIDVRPDFKGLPKGAGSVALGEQVWEAQCASCHGSFGESNEVFTPIVGGTTKADIERHRAINALLKEELDSGVHALALEPSAPGEATRR